MSDSIESLIPHRAPMRFIDALSECTDTTACATVCFHADSFAVADGAVIETALVECVAQTVAAAMGRRGANGGQSEKSANGMLVGIGDFQIHSRALPETQLRIEIRELKRFESMLMISGNISCEGQSVASGVLTLYV